MRSSLLPSKTLVVAIGLSLLACSSDRSGELADVELSAGQGSSLSPVSNVQTFFDGLTGVWYGEVPGIYKACAQIKPVDPNTPWSLQTVELVVEEGTRHKVEFTLSRNGSPVTPEPVFFVVARADADVHAPFRSGDFLLVPTRRQNEGVFWNYTTGPDGPSGQMTSTKGLLFRILEGGELDGSLQIGSFSGDAYCTRPAGAVLCGTGGFRPFIMKRQTCPSNF